MKKSLTVLLFIGATSGIKINENKNGTLPLALVSQKSKEVNITPEL